MARYTTLKTRAERYAAEEMGWPEARALDAKPAGDGRAVAVLIEPGDGCPFVIACDEWDRLATDAGLPEDFGWEVDDV